MALIYLVIALLIEQWKPLAERKQLFAPVDRFASMLEGQFNAGQSRQGMIAWALAILPAMLLVWLVYSLLLHINPVLAIGFNVVMLYLTMGFRRFSHFFTDIQLAMRADDIDQARRLLSDWRGQDCTALPPDAVARLAIEQARAASHYNVFAVMFWFILLPGPSGAVAYRMASYLARRWQADQPELDQFGRFARRIYAIMEWLPTRLTAAAFAVVGDFEDAVYCWRNQAARWTDPLLGVVLAAGAGAIGVRLGGPIQTDIAPEDRPDLGIGDEADAGFLDSTVGLVWRALVLWLLMLLLLGLASIR